MVALELLQPSLGRRVNVRPFVQKLLHLARAWKQVLAHIVYECKTFLLAKAVKVKLRKRFISSKFPRMCMLEFEMGNLGNANELFI